MKVIRHILILIKIFLLLEFAIVSGMMVMWGFFSLLAWIKYGEIDLDFLIRLLKGVTLGCIFASLVFWFAYYLWPIFKNRNTF